MHERLNQIADEYAKLEQEEIQWLNIGSLQAVFEWQRTAFLSSIN